MHSNYSSRRYSQFIGDTELLHLSHGQEAMWFLYQIAPQSIAYNIYTTVRIISKLDLEAWRRSWLLIGKRHPILRTTYTEREGQPIQEVHSFPNIDINITDASDWNLEYLHERILEIADHPYKLETDPVLRVHLFLRSIEEHILLLVMHHIAGDMWSFDILLNEFRVLYTHESQISSQADLRVIENSHIADFPLDRILPLPKLSYTDYVLWQRKMLASSQGEELSTYWQKQLAGELPILDLPFDKSRPSVQTYSGSTYLIELNVELGQSLRSFSVSVKSSLYRIFLAALFVLFYRISGQEDILVGCPMAGRFGQEEFKEIVGYFTDPVVLRANLAGNPSFKEFLTQVSQTVNEAQEYQDYPFPLLVQQLAPERDSSLPPLFQVALTWQKHRWYKNPETENSSLLMSPYIIEGHQRGSAFDIDLAIIDAGNELYFCWQYNTDLFDAATVERIAENYQTLITGIVENPQEAISQLPLLTEIEQHQLLIEWNQHQKEYRLDRCIHELFIEQVEKAPNAIALEFEGEKLTYQELNQRANQLAAYLQELGVKAEVIVGICLERSLSMVVGLLGILKAGGAYLPLDPAYPSDRLEYMLNDSQAKILLTQQQLINIVPKTEAKIICLDTDWEIISKQNSNNPETEVQPQNLAYVIYTSGSTGKPKGVAIEHRSLVNFSQAVRDKYQITEADRVLQAASISFDAAAEEIYPCLIGGATLVLRTSEMLSSISTFIQKCWEWELTVVLIGTAYWQQLTSELAIINETLPPSVRLISTGGEKWLPEKLKLWQKCMEKRSRIQNLTQPPLLMNGYGPTEATVLSTVYELSELVIEEAAPRQLIGKAFDNVEVYILDRYLQPVPIGVAGELHIGGVGLARGYLHRPDLTDLKFIPHPFKKTERLYKTGDLARYLADGNIEFLGRIDNQVKIRGFRIELGEIETALVSHPEILEAVVIDDEVNDSKRLVAYVVTRLRSNNKLNNKHELRSFLKQRLPDYMIPSAFVMLDALPLTPNGKVNRQGLPKPETTGHEREIDLVEPRTKSEAILAKIWREVLHLNQVSIHDNFFELGGDSILSIQMIFIANQTGLQLSAKQIFENQTIAELAAVTNSIKIIKAEQGLVSGKLPLTPVQQLFFAQNPPEPHHFNQSFLLEVPQTIDPNLLPAVVQQLLIHHDALRLRFVQSNSGWEQINAYPDDNIPFSYIDLSGIPETEQKQAISSTASSLQVSLNISSGLIIKVVLFGLGADKTSRLLIIIHHLAVDGVSWRILLEDLETAYNQASRGEKIQLRPKTTSFKDWSEKLTTYANSNTAKQELNYWQRISLQNISRLPIDCSLGANTVKSTHIVSVSLSTSETRALLQEVPKAYKTQINDILLTALVQTFGKWIASNFVLLDLEGHGREDIFEDVDLSRTVGWFTTVFPMLLELKVTANLGDIIKSIKEQIRALPKRGIGYGVLRYLSEDREVTSQLAAIPSAEVSFNYLGQFDWGTVENSFLKLASESVGLEHSQEGISEHLIDINGLIVEGQLKLDWTYSENFHYRETIENLAQDFMINLRSLITHCLSIDAPVDVLSIDAQSYSNENSSGKHDENNLSIPLHLLELPKHITNLLPEDTEAAYPLAKMQEFMLYHYSNDRQKMGVYHGQESYDISDENLDLNAFTEALKILVRKHPTLRTVFIFEDGKPVCQVVKKDLHFFINEKDISNLKPQQQENYIDKIFQQDRQNLLDVQNPQQPLFRIYIFQKSQNRIEFFMSMHHAITDGWSGIEFFNQLCDLYTVIKQGKEIKVVPETNVYKEFVALEQEIINSKEAKNFWKMQLQKYVHRPLQPLTNSPQQLEATSLDYSFDTKVAADLREFCRQLKVSPKALLLSAYLDLISNVSKENKVTVGIISNGRTEKLSDPFGALGLFWNIVPFCQQIVENKHLQIKNVQQSLFDIEPYVRYPLLEILTDRQTKELFFATFNFVNFHNNHNNSEQNSLKVNRTRIYDKFNFPLNFSVSISSYSEDIKLHIEYDRLYFSIQDIRSMIEDYSRILI